jgi:PAS domain S-box-containing protein
MGESLRDSEGRFRAIFDNANDGILLADGELKKFYIGNNTICQMLGYSLEEIKNLGVTDIHLKEDLPYVIGQFEKQSRREIALAKDIPMKRKDGSVFYADVNSSFVTLAGRKYLIGVFRDTTERKKAEEKLRESEERFHIAAETSNDVVYEWDMQHSIQWFGKIDEMLGYGPGEFPRTMDGWTESVHPEDRQRVMAAIQAYLDGRLPYVIEYRIRRKDGAYQWWAARGAAARTPDGHPVRWIGTITDITERKKAEEAMERLSRNLQATVEELTRSNKELQEFVRIAAHDLKTPIRAIGTLADWILTDYKDKLDESGQEKVKLLVGRAKRIDGMINGLLQYSRMGHTRGKGKEVDLNIVLSEVIREIAPPENVEITIQNELPAVICEKRRMVQVFRNLLINSLKYIDKPMGQIRVGCVGEDGFWKFSICDNGCGIEQKYFGKIFKVFQKLTSQDETEGTGIGLAIVRKIVELYGGSVWVESKPEEGSTFFFTLPKQETRPGEVPGRSQMGVKNAKLKACIVG